MALERIAARALSFPAALMSLELASAWLELREWAPVKALTNAARFTLKAIDVPLEATKTVLLSSRRRARPRRPLPFFQLANGMLIFIEWRTTMALRRLILLAMLASLAFASGAEAVREPTISNDCGVECFPCMGDADPFCRQPAPPWPEGIPFVCQKCVVGPNYANCEPVGNGQTGNTACGTVTDGNSVVACVTAGSFCSSITVNP